jgi:thioredoxin-like negative regulator of GroEL
MINAHVMQRYLRNKSDERQEGKPVNIRQQGQASDVSADSLDRLVINSPIPILVNFQTPWSRRMVPLLGQLAEAFAGRLRVVQVNISAHPELAARFKIRAVPTLLIFKKGVPVEFIVGTVPSRFVFETVCKTLGVSPRLTQTRRARRTRRWPSIWTLAFDSTLA